MADKKLTLVVQAKNMLARGLSSVGNSLASIGKMAGRALGTVAKWAGIAASALGGISAVGAIKAFMVQEKAARDLAQALELNGDALDVYVPKLHKAAAAIQDQTGFADEQTLDIMAQARMYGIVADKLEDAAKGTIALTRAGMGQEMAVRALVAAQDGNFEALTRYIPALRTANDESEKARIVNDFLSKQYAAAKGDLSTMAGAWRAIKGRIGDALESVGQLLIKAVDLPGLMERAAAAAKRLGDRLAEWLKGDQFKAVKENIEGIISAIGQGGEVRNAVVLSLANIMLAALKDGGNYIAEQIRAALKDTTLGKLTGDIKTGLGVMFSARKRAQALYDVTGIEALRPADTGQSNLIQGRGSAMSKAMKEFNDAIAKARKTAAKDAPPIIPVAPIEEVVVALANETNAIEAEQENREATAKELADKEIALAEEIAEAHKQATKEAFDKEAQALKDRIALQEELAKKTIEQFLAEKRAAEDAAKAAKKEDDRERRLLGKQGRGVRLSKRDAEFLEARQAIQAAQRQLPGLQGQLQVAQDNLAALNRQERTMRDMLAEMQDINRQQAQLLAMG